METNNQRKQNMPQHDPLLKPSLHLGPSTTVNVDYAKYLLRILVLFKFSRVSNGTYTSGYSCFLKKWGKILNTQIFYTVGPIIHKKNYIIVNTKKIKKSLQNLYYIESEASSEYNQVSAMEL